MNIAVQKYVIEKVVVAPEGRIDAFNVAELSAEFDKQLANHIVNFIIDLTKVDFLDSAGIAALVRLLKRARAGGGDVKLVWPAKSDAQRILRLTKFDRVFDMFDSAEMALTK